MSNGQGILAGAKLTVQLSTQVTNDCIEDKCLWISLCKFCSKRLKNAKKEMISLQIIMYW
jgi:hypothetical protein